jgi:hypothetical protein
LARRRIRITGIDQQISGRRLLCQVLFAQTDRGCTKMAPGENCGNTRTGLYLHQGQVFDLAVCLDAAVKRAEAQTLNRVQLGGRL